MNHTTLYTFVFPSGKALCIKTDKWLDQLPESIRKGATKVLATDTLGTEELKH